VDARLADADARARQGDPAPFGWFPLVALILVTLVDRIETSVIAGVLPLLQEEWGFSDTAGGAIPTAAGLAGLLVTLPAGRLADRVDRRRLVAWVVASWSFVITGSALATGFGMFFATRVVLGAADSLEGPAASSALSDYYAPKARARVYGYHRMASFAGAPIGALLGGVLGEVFGWRSAFFFMIVPGLLVALVVRRLPEPRRGDVDRAVALLGAGDAGPTPEPPAPVVGIEPVVPGDTRIRTDVRALLRIPTVGRLYVGLLVLFLGLAGLAFWMPSFFERVHGLGEGAAASLAAGIGLIGVGVGATVGGVLGDRWHGTRPGARVSIGATGQILGSVAGVAAFASPALAVRAPLLAVAVAFLSLGIPNISAAIADVLPAQRRGLGFALLNFMVALGGSFGPVTVGVLSDVYGSLTGALATLAAPMVLGSLVVLSARRTYDDDAAAVMAAALRDAHDHAR
jgi:MFS family permease